MAGSKKINHSKKQKSKRCSRTNRAGLNFPVGRIHRLLRKGKYAERISAVAPVYLTAVIEYLCSEVLELAGKMDDTRNNIIPTDIKFAIELDEELRKFLPDIIFPNSEVFEMVHSALLVPKKFKPGSILW